MNKIAFLLLAITIGATFTGFAGALSNPINSSVENQTTTVPLAYRAIVGIILIIVVIFAVLKFFKIFISAVIAIILLLIISSTAYYFFTSGAFSIHNSLAFLGDAWNFFFGTASKTIGTISNINSTISNLTSSINSIQPS